MRLKLKRRINQNIDHKFVVPFSGLIYTMKFKLFLSILLLFFSDYSASQEIVGWVEKALLTKDDILIEAKIDSGARHSSLHCDCVTTVKDNGEKWVHLKIDNKNGDSLELDKKVIRQARIKRHDGKFQMRNVIHLSICLGGIRKMAEVNLIDRSGLNYQLLVGRSFLKNDFLINTSEKYINDPRCSI